MSRAEMICEYMKSIVSTVFMQNAVVYDSLSDGKPTQRLIYLILQVGNISLPKPIPKGGRKIVRILVDSEQDRQDILKFQSDLTYDILSVEGINREFTDIGATRANKHKNILIARFDDGAHLVGSF